MAGWRRLAVTVGLAALLLALDRGASTSLLARAERVVSAFASRPTPRSLERDGLPLRSACRAAGISYPPPSPRVEVRKAERVLGLYSGTVLLKEYRMALGPNAVPDKERQGDNCTPLGDFYVCTRLERSRYYRFTGLSYPGPEDAERGLRGGLITRAQHAGILEAHQGRRQPPWGTRLGGAIGIHGGGTFADWTAGCIALENEHIDELFPLLRLGTPVRIRE